MDPRVRLLSLSRACALPASLLHAIIIIAIGPHCKRHFRFIIEHNGLLREHNAATCTYDQLQALVFMSFNFSKSKM